jgi:hypothetical protein
MRRCDLPSCGFVRRSATSSERRPSRIHRHRRAGVRNPGPAPFPLDRTRIFLEALPLLVGPRRTSATAPRRLSCARCSALRGGFRSVGVADGRSRGSEATLVFVSHPARSDGSSRANPRCPIGELRRGSQSARNRGVRRRHRFGQDAPARRCDAVPGECLGRPLGEQGAAPRGDEHRGMCSSHCSARMVKRPSSLVAVSRRPFFAPSPAASRA